MITVVIMNWKRPDNVKQILVRLSEVDAVSQVLVWNNNFQCAPSSFMTHSPKVTLIDSTRDMSLFTRFAAATLAANECILYHDDDVLLPRATIDSLFSAYSREPDRIHGLYGRRRSQPGNKYGVGTKRGPCPIILTTAMMAHRRYAAMALAMREHPVIGPILLEGRPYGNGEDLVISYVAMKTSGQLNLAHELFVQKLSRPDAICRRWPNHFNYRTRLMRALDEHVIRLG